MAALVCDLCGGKLVMGAGGIAVCDSCGMEHSADRMKEKVQEIKGTVRVDNSHMVDTYLEMTATALEAGNNEEAENYANKVIEIDPRSAKAWLYKGKAAGWQTTGRNNRYPESIVNWINAYSFASADEKDFIVENIKSEAMNISAAILQMECNSFANFRSDDNANDVTKALDMIEKQLGLLKEKTDIDIYINPFKTILARTVNTGAVNASNNADADFGPENRNRDKFNWDRYTDAQDRCLNLLDKAYDLSNDDDLCHTICKNYIAIAEEVRDSCSYKFQASAYSDGTYVRDYSFTSTAKENRTNTINEWKKKRDNHDPDKRKENCKKAITHYTSSCGEANRKLAIAQYWESHTSEKAALESELSEIEKQKAHLHEAASQDANRAQIAKLDNEISTTRSQMNSLGLFKGKEKKALAFKIEELNAQKSNYEKVWSATKSGLDSDEAKLNARAKEINNEFIKDRGMAKITPKQYLSVFTNGHGVVSAMDLVSYHKNILPDGIAVKGEGEEAVVNYTQLLLMKAQAMLAIFSALAGNSNAVDEMNLNYEDDPEKTKNYRINFVVGNEDTNISANFMAKTINAPIGEILYYELEEEKTPTAVANFIQIVTSAVVGICPDIKTDGLDQRIAEIAYGLAPTAEISVNGHICTISGSTKSDLKFEIKPTV